MGDCPFKRTWNVAPAPPPLPAQAAPPAFGIDNKKEHMVCRQRSPTFPSASNIQPSPERSKD